MSLETMTKLATYTVGAGGISSFSFSGIPQTYTDLILKASARVSGSEPYATGELRMQFNSDTTAANYKYMQHWGLGTGSVGSNTGSNFFFGNIEGGGMTANVFSSTEVCIPNYAGNSFKTAMFFSAEEASAAAATIASGVTKWSATAPITSITILSNANPLVQHSTFTLYGVKAMRTAVGNSIKATGGAIAFDGTYVIHTFNSSGTFTPTSSLTADYLVIAGGAGGGAYIGGGGGAGGLRSTISATGGGGTVEPRISLSPNTPYTVTVGAGGTGGVTPSTAPLAGSNSAFSTITSTGGGCGGYYNGSVWNAGVTGGSGGGGGIGSFAGGSGTTNQGYAGGTGGTNTGNTSAAAGGGGAGAVGSNGATSVPGNGGAGVTNSITGISVTYAGGGGGSAHTSFSNTSVGGSGGGGNGGSSSIAGSNGLTNTGSGGGGGGVGYNGGAGGSGIVIIRYKG